MKANNLLNHPTSQEWQGSGVDARQAQTFAEKFREECLEGSGIDPILYETAIEIIPDYRSAPGNDPEYPIDEALNHTAKRNSSLRHPWGYGAAFLHENGKVWQIKPEFPRPGKKKDKQGNVTEKPIKYETPKGNDPDPFLPFVPPAIQSKIIGTPQESFWDYVIKTPEIPIVITEGGKKGLCLLSNGYVGLALNGCYGWSKGKELSPVLEKIVWEGRRVTLAFDQDSKPETVDKVNKAIAGLGFKLQGSQRKHGLNAEVYVATWNPEAGKGIDDLTVNKGVDCLHQVLRDATPLVDWKYPDRKEKKNTPTGTEGTPANPTQDPDEKSMLAKRLERVQKAVGNQLRLNTLNKQIEFEGEQLDTDDLRVLLAKEKNLSIPSNDASAIFKFIAQRNQYNPVLEYLERVSKEYGNDTSVLEGFAKRYFGQEEAIYDTYIKRFLVGAVARVMKPGCKLDSALFLQGDQGTFKSTFFKVLASEEWFDDSMGAASDKDERLKLHSVWIVEWAELETMFKRKDISAVKSFLTTTKDLIRPPYGRDTKEFKRQCVIVGTTNEDEFLKDPTGSRRFWVIPVQKPIPIDQLAQERDRIWAAAYALYQSGEQWYLTREESQQQAILNEYFQEVDPWQDYVLDYIQDKMRVSTNEILEMCIKKELRDTDKKDQMRIAAILQSLGWERSGQGKDGLGNKARLFKPKNISFLAEKVVTVVTPSPNPPLGKDSRVSQPSHNLSQPQGGVVTPPPPPPLPEVTTSQPVPTSNDGVGTPSTPYGQGISAKVSQPSQPLDQDLGFFSDQAHIKTGDRVAYIGSKHDYLEHRDVLEVKSVDGGYAMCDHTTSPIIGIRLPIADLTPIRN